MKARENRKRRLKRDRRELERLAVKYGRRDAYRKTGKSPSYYDVVCVRVKEDRRSYGQRRIKSLLRVIPNREYVDLMHQLVDGHLRSEIGIVLLDDLRRVEVDNATPPDAPPG